MQQTLVNRAVAEYQTLCRKNKEIAMVFRQEALRISQFLNEQEKLTDRTFPTQQQNLTTRDSYVPSKPRELSSLEEEEEEYSIGVGLRNLASPPEDHVITNMKNEFQQQLNHKLSEFK